MSPWEQIKLISNLTLAEASQILGEKINIPKEEENSDLLSEANNKYDFQLPVDPNLTLDDIVNNQENRCLLSTLKFQIV
jgi:hypothetical protein